MTWVIRIKSLNLIWQILIRQIEDSDDVFAISTAISNLLSLTQDGPQLCSIIAKVWEYTHTHTHMLVFMVYGDAP